MVTTHRLFCTIASIAAVVVGCEREHLSSPASAPLLSVPQPPTTTSVDTTDTFFGREVHDPYRWLEQDSTDRRSWIQSENAYSRAALARLPNRELWRSQLQKALQDVESVDSVKVAAGHVFFLQRPPGAQTPRLVVREGSPSRDRVLVDTDAGVHRSEHMTLLDFEPSPDGRYVTYRTTIGGSEATTLRVVEVATGTVLPEFFKHTEAVSSAWLPTSEGFFYPCPTSIADDSSDVVYTKIATYLHRIGSDPRNDKRVFGRGVSDDADRDERLISQVLVDLKTGLAVGVLDQGMEQELMIYTKTAARLSDSGERWKKIVDASDQVVSFAVHDGDIFLLTHKDAPHFQLKKMRLEDTGKAQVVVGESQAVLKKVFASKDALYVLAAKDGSSEVLRGAWGSGQFDELRPPFRALLWGAYATTGEDGLVVDMEGWSNPSRWYRIGATSPPMADMQITPRKQELPFAEEYVEVPSADGVRVPLSIIYRRDRTGLEGMPAVLAVYGAYGKTVEAAFLPSKIPWIESGGVWAFAHVRGGGDRGDAWHRDGMRDRKTNSIRDFIACAEYIRRRTGGPVGAEAHSAGGIVVGMAVATRPDLFGASYIDGGVLNILRFETTAAGPSNLDEFGSTKTEEGTRSLLSIDVLGAMRPGVKYPPMLLSAAANDTTVPLWQSAKVVARLQSLSNVETFISVNQDDGHGASSTASQDVERATDSWAFFSYYLHQATGAGQLTFEGSK